MELGQWRGCKKEKSQAVNAELLTERLHIYSVILLVVTNMMLLGKNDHIASLKFVSHFISCE